MSVGEFLRDFVNTIPGLHVGEHAFTREPARLWALSHNGWCNHPCSRCQYAQGVPDNGRLLHYVTRWCEMHRPRRDPRFPWPMREPS